MGKPSSEALYVDVKFGRINICRLRCARKIRADFARLFPAWAGVEIGNEWSGLVTLSARRTPYVGPIPELDGAFAALAYHGNGVAMGSYSGAMVADLILGRAPTRPYPDAMRDPLLRFPAPRFRRGLFAGVMALMALSDRL